MLDYKKIGYIASGSQRSSEVLEKLLKTYDLIDVNSLNNPQLDAVIILGGDGFMLRNACRYLGTNIHLYGINCGTVGFLLNDFDSQSDLIKKIQNSYAVKINPLGIQLCHTNNKKTEINAINEISLLRSSYMAVCLRIKINGKLKINRLVADGLLVSTPIGSSAYNFSVGGPILPLYCDLLSIAPISPFRPRRWSGAIIPGSVEIEVQLIDPSQRQASISVDFQCFSDVESILIKKRDDLSVTILFDSQFCLEDRMINEQFIRD